MAQTVTIVEQKVCPESESLKFSATPTPQVENPSDSTALLLIVLFWVNSKICRKTDFINLLCFLARMFGTDARLLRKVEILHGGAR